MDTMKTRRVISLTAVLSFIVMLLTSVILYIVPSGRIAYWANWQLWGLDKGQWAAIHINTGFLMLLALSVHIYFNHKAIFTYLKNRTRQIQLFNRDFNSALVIVAVCVLGTYSEIPPFSSILSLSESIKADAALEYGEPPYGHAELSTLNKFSKTMGFDPEQSLAVLRKVGFEVENGNQQIKAIAEANSTSPQHLLLAMQANSTPVTAQSLDEAPSGLGKLSISTVCQRYGFDLDKTLAMLQAQGLEASNDSTMKELANQLSVSPHDIWDSLVANQ
jgi:hypothetical protein